MNDFKKHLSVFLILIVFAIPVLVFAQNIHSNRYESAQTTSRIELWKDINSGKACSACVAISENGRIVYAEGFGMANREQSIPVDENTIFNIASVSKVFAAAAIMLLVDEGKIDLDMPVTDYLSDFTMSDPRYKSITVRMLLNHTSGIPSSSAANTVGYEYNPTINRQILDMIKRSTLLHEPGSMGVYCNDGFALAEMIVERISGKSYIDFLSERIFMPLKMENTGLTIGKAEDKEIALCYSFVNGQREPIERLSSSGAGGLSSTAVDLCKFADVFTDAGNELFSSSALNEMRALQSSAFAHRFKNPYMTFGLGWDYTDLPQFESQGIKVIGKSGQSIYYSSMLFTVPELNLSLAVIESGSEGRAVEIAANILEKVLIEKGLLQKTPITASKPLEHQPLPTHYKTFEGYYNGSAGNVTHVKVDEENNTINFFSIDNGQENPVISFFYNEGYLYDETQSENKSYFTTVDGRDYYVYLSLGTDFAYMEKLEDAQEPKKLKIDIDGKVWLRRNVRSYEAKALQAYHIKRSFTVDELSGYCFFNGIKKIESPDFANFVAGSMRDQKSLRLVEKDDGLWAWISDLLYSPVELIEELKKGNNLVTIGSEGYNEWLKAKEDTVLSFEIPEKSRIIIFSSARAPIYDSLTEKHAVFVKRGSFIELIGNPGDIFRVLSE